MSFPRYIDITEFLDRYNGSNGENIHLKDCESFVSSLPLSFQAKISVLIVQYTAYPQLDAEGEQFQDYAYTFSSALLDHLKEVLASYLEQADAISPAYYKTFLANTGSGLTQKTKDYLKGKLLNLTHLLTTGDSREAALKRLSQLSAFVTRLIMLLELYIADIPMEPEIPTKVISLLNQRNIRVGAKKMIDSQHIYQVFLDEFIEDVMYAVARTFKKLQLPKSKDLTLARKDAIYCQMFEFVSHLLGIEHDDPKIELGIFFLRVAKDDGGIAKIKSSHSKMKNSKVKEITKSVIRNPNFHRFLLRKALWMTDNAYYFDYLRKLNNSHPRFESRKALRKNLEYYIMLVASWDGQ